MNKLHRNTVFYTFGNILPKLGSFLLIPIYSQELSPSEYGIVYSLQALVSVLTIFFTLSLNRAIFRLFYDYKTIEKQRIFISNIINVIFIVSLIFFLILTSFGNFFSKIYKSIDFYPYFFYILVFIFFNSFETVPKTLLQVREKAKHFVILNLIQFLVKNSLILILIVRYDMGAEGYLLGQALSSVILSPVFIFLVKDFLVFKINFSIIKKTLAFSLPMIPGNMSAWILNLSDRIFIERYFSINDVGIYSLGYQIAGILLIFSGAIKKAFDPHFYNLSNSLSDAEAKKKLSKDITLYITIVFMISFLIALFAKEFIKILIDIKFYEAHKIVPIIVFSYFISHLSGYYNLMIYQKKKSIAVMYIILSGALINIILNFILIPRYGIWGASWATVISFFILLVANIWRSKKYYYIPINFYQLFILFIICSSLIILFNYFLEFSIVYSVIIKVIIFISIILLIYIKYKKEVLILLGMKK